jgi:tetratricopeptide (TPR) repeat protein
MADFEEAIRLEPRNTHALAARGEIHALQKDYERAIADFTEADDRYFLAAGYYLRAQAYQSKKDYAKAIDDLTRVIKIDPGTTIFYVLEGERVAVIADELTMFGHLARGSAYLATHDTQNAVRDFTEVLLYQGGLIRRPARANMVFPAAYYGRALAHAEGKEHDRAIMDLDAAIKLSPHVAEAYSARGGAYWSKGAYGAAMVDYLRAARLRYLPW